jgi:hypothetical protein
LCDESHYIRVEILTDIVKDHISGIVKFAKDFRDDFVSLIMGENHKQAKLIKKKNQDTLQRLINRNNELDTLFEKIFEDKSFGRLSEERFLKLSVKYEDEQLLLKDEIKNLVNTVSKETSNENNVYEFLKIVNRNSEVKELTREILNEFVDKIIVWHAEKINGVKSQKIEIHYKLIGYINFQDKISLEKKVS